MIACVESFDTAWNDYHAARLSAAKPSTLKTYAICRAQFAEFLQRDPCLPDFNDCTMGKHLGWLLTKMKPVTVNQRRDRWLAFWRWAFHHGYLTTWPEVRKVAEPERTPKGWHVHQIKQLLAAAARETGTIAEIPASDYWQALLWFWWHGGERSGATFLIRLDAVDWEAGEIDAPGAIRKAGKAERHIMGAAAMEAIRKIRQPTRELLFPWPMHWTMVYHRLRRVCKRAGLPYRPPKSMRISFASHLEAAGGNATEALQHTSRSTTRKSYLDPAIVKRARHCDRLPEL